MKNANTPATKRSRNREYRTKPGGGKSTAIQIQISKDEADALKYLQQERNMTPAEVLRLGIRYAGV